MEGKRVRMEMVLLSVPLEVLDEAGIQRDGLLEMYAEGSELIIRNADDPTDLVCAGDCGNCPMNEYDCTGTCASCPHCGECSAEVME